MSDFLKVLNERTSVEHFDAATPISVHEIKELISEACQAPSSFNIQHWRFIAVTDERIRERLKGTTIAPNQERVATAPLIFLILGDLNGHKRLEGILDETVHAGLLPREVADVWLTMANGTYGSDPRLARDEAIRSASLAAMTLMLAAGNRGYVSCPIGFNPVQDGDPEHQRSLCTRHDARGWSSRCRELRAQTAASRRPGCYVQRLTEVRMG